MGGTALHGWAFSTRTFQRMVFGGDGGATDGIDEDYAARGFDLRFDFMTTQAVSLTSILAASGPVCRACAGVR